jgi:hypothetical protein
MDNVIPPPDRFSPAWVDFVIVLGALLVLAILLFFWVLVFHKPRRRHRKRKHHHSHRGQFKKGTDGIREMIRQRRHGHHRHEHQPLNPTLAQTGGLPPLRDEDKPPPPQP